MFSRCLSYVWCDGHVVRYYKYVWTCDVMVMWLIGALSQVCLNVWSDGHVAHWRVITSMFERVMWWPCGSLARYHKYFWTCDVMTMRLRFALLHVCLNVWCHDQVAHWPVITCTYTCLMLHFSIAQWHLFSLLAWLITSSRVSYFSDKWGTGLSQLLILRRACNRCSCIC